MWWQTEGDSVAAEGTDEAATPSSEELHQDTSFTHITNNTSEEDVNVTQGEQTRLCYVNSLPREILLYIFSFLSVEELGRSVQPVCVMWRNLAKEPILRTRLCIPFRVDEEQFQTLLTGAPLLQTLKLTDRYDTEELLLHAASCCPKLKNLSIFNCIEFRDNVLRSLMENCRDLQSLQIQLSGVRCSEQFHQVPVFVHLHHLSISDCSGMDDAMLIKIIKQCPSLEHLDIYYVMPISDKSVIFIAENLCHSLKSLFLHGQKLTDASYQSLGACTHLEKLEVSLCERLTDEALLGLMNLRHLTCLTFSDGFSFSSQGLRSLFEDGKLTQLVNVDLSMCYNVDDSVLVAMARCCPNLCYLTLNNCNDVTDAGIEAIIAGCPRLRELCLFSLEKLTGSAFSNVHTTLPDLTDLMLDYCSNVDFSHLQPVVNQKPSLRVGDSSGNFMEPHISKKRHQSQE